MIFSAPGFRTAEKYGTEKKTRNAKMHDMVELCDKILGYESSLLIAGVGENVDALNVDGAADCVLNLGTLQKEVKYGISDIDAIAMYEMGFADRVVGQALGPVIASAAGRTVRGRLRNSADAVRRTLEQFPRYFTGCLSSLL